MGIDRFGASGKAADLFKHFGFTADNVAKRRSANSIRFLVRGTQGRSMAIKVGINGYGRIGRNILRALYESEAHAARSRSSRSTISATRRPMRT